MIFNTETIVIYYNNNGFRGHKGFYRNKYMRLQYIIINNNMEKQTPRNSDSMWRNRKRLQINSYN